jgi:A/G-specific adenine glycosylase
MWDKKKISRFRAKLLGWYRRHRRDLPWRHDASPYRIWISEIMLQQTQASTVRLYYERFLKRFPDIASLAKARESDVLHAWSGLGYYRRARHLHRAAKQIVDNGGTFPGDFSAVVNLPGIGRYTAGAICSIAFHQPYPVVDGNVRRVLARLTQVRSRVPESYYWDWMSAWLSERAPGNFNQGMMELGALVCTPLQPRCFQCPVRTFCRARASGTAEQIPAARTRKAVQRLGIALLLLEWDRRVLLTAADKRAFIPGAWGLPWIQIQDHHLKEESAQA